MMANEYAFRNFSKMKSPRKSMCFIFIKDTIRPFSVLSGSCPNPTCMSFFDIFPKSNFRRNNFKFNITIPASFVSSIGVKKLFSTIKTIWISFIASCVPAFADGRINSHLKFLSGVVPRTFNDVAGFCCDLNIAILEVF